MCSQAGQYREKAGQTTAVKFFRSGCPFNLLNVRYAAPTCNPDPDVVSSTTLAQIKDILDAVTQHKPSDIQAFRQETPRVERRPSPLAEDSPKPPQTYPQTEKEFNLLSQHLTKYTLLSTLSWITGVGTDADVFKAIVEDLSVGEKRPASNQETIDVFKRNHQGKLTLWGKVKLRLFSFFRVDQLISKTVHTYMQSALAEIRRLRDGQLTLQRGFLERLIKDLSDFFESYGTMISNYADSKDLTKNLEAYREEAFEKQPRERLQILSKRFSDTIIKYLSPKIFFYEGTWFLPRFANYVLNHIVSFIIKRTLPSGIHSTILQANDATKPHFLPFANALTEFACAQVKILKDSVEMPPSPPSTLQRFKSLITRSQLVEGPDTTQNNDPTPMPLDGTGGLKDAIKNFLHTIQYSHCKDRLAILSKRKEMSRKADARGPLDGQIEQGIHDAIEMGIHVLLRYLAKPENFETVFMSFLEVANAPFSEEPMVDPEKFTASQNELTQEIKELGIKLARVAIREQMSSHQVEVLAKETFIQRKKNAEKMLMEVQDKIGGSSPDLPMLINQFSHESALSQLHLLQQILEAYRKKEKGSVLPKGVSGNKALEASILIPLLPIYGEVHALTRDILCIQDELLKSKARDHLTQRLEEIKDHLTRSTGDLTELKEKLHKTTDEIVRWLDISKSSVTRSGTQMQMRRSSLDTIKKTRDQLCIGIANLLDNRNQLSETQTTLASFRVLKDLLNQLKETVENNFPERKRELLTQIRTALQSLPERDRETLSLLINKYSQDHSKQALDSAWHCLDVEVSRVEKKHKDHKNSLTSQGKRLKEACENIITNFKPLEVFPKNEDALQPLIKTFQKHLSSLTRSVQRAEKEKQIPLDSNQAITFGIASVAMVLPPLAYSFPTFSWIPGVISATLSVIPSQVSSYLRGTKDIKKASALTGATLISSAMILGGSEYFIPIVGPIISTVASLLSARYLVYEPAVNTVAQGAEDKILDEITSLGSQAHEHLLSGGIYMQLVKILMREIIDDLKRHSL